MKLSYFPGCSSRGTSKEYGESTLAVMSALGHELVEIPDWNCCGATSAHALDENLRYLLPLRNLVLAEGTGLEMITTPCSACYNVMKQTESTMLAGGAQAERFNHEIETVTGRRYAGKARMVHPLYLLSRPEELKKIRERAVRPLHGLQVVMYYGCYLSRPSEVVAFESPEQPTSMDEIGKAVGADVKRWSWKVDCCGGSLTLPRASVVQGVVDRLTSEAVKAGADAIVTPCPMCMNNLDSRQDARKSRGETPVPVLYYTELIAMAFGMPRVRRWLGKRLTNPMPLLRAKGFAGVLHRAGPAAVAGLTRAARAGGARGGISDGH